MRVALSMACVGVALVVAVTAPASRAEPGLCASSRMEMRTLANAIEVFKALHGRIPNDAEWRDGLDGLVEPAYFVDRWGGGYVYTPSPDGTFAVRSVGPDGQLGTSDDVGLEGDCPSLPSRTWSCCAL